MAYGNRGAFVYLNGKRREDKEDVCLFGGNNDMSHGVLGDGTIRVKLYKNEIPYIYDNKKVIEFENCSIIKNETDEYEQNFDIEVEYKGHKFKFYNKWDNAVAEMIDDKGNNWKGESGYMFGAGFEDVH